MKNLEHLKNELYSINFLELVLEWNEEHFNDYLDFRDSEAFENNWLVAAADILEKENEAVIPVETIDDIREIVFKKAFSLTKNADFAASVSDDFELIAKNFFFENKNNYFNNMWNCYKSGKVPR